MGDAPGVDQVRVVADNAGDDFEVGHAAREGIETLLIERSGLGGQAAISIGIDNFPGFPEGISGNEFADRVVRQARRFGVEILQAQDVARLCWNSAKL